MKTVFLYKEELTGENDCKIARPVADVHLKTSTGLWIEFHPYIDSGADITMIPHSLGKLLGLRIADDKVNQIGGIRGSVPIVYATVSIKIGALEFPVHVAWALTEEVPPLLGRTDIFDKFDVTFQQTKSQIIFDDKKT